MKPIFLLLAGAALASCTAPPHLTPRVIRTTSAGAYVIDVLLLPDDGRPAPISLPRK